MLDELSGKWEEMGAGCRLEVEKTQGPASGIHSANSSHW